MIFRRVSAVTLLLCAFIANGGPAQAGDDYFTQPFRISWKPQSGYTTTSAVGVTACGLTNPYCHRVLQHFRWDEAIALAKLDYPRTGESEGTYEHELRFWNPGLTAFRQGWCSRDFGGPQNEISNLPPDSYFDTFEADQSEFSYGIQAWRAEEDLTYSVQFDCSPLYLVTATPPSYAVSTATRYSLTAQLGHCDQPYGPPCTTWNNYGDAHVRLIPRFKGLTTSNVVDWSGSFDSNYNLEWLPAGSNVDEPYVYNATLTRPCSGASQGSCYWRVNPSNTSPAGVHYVEAPSPSSGGTANLYSEWTVRCPSSQNSQRCIIRFLMRGYDASGAVVTTQMTNWTTLENDNVWWVYRQLSDIWPSNVVSWRFKAEIDYGDVLDVDYHQHWYDLPS
jgi:hypothetical protein